MGATLMMTQSGPSWEGVRIGITCVALWAIFMTIGFATLGSGRTRKRAGRSSTVRLANPDPAGPLLDGPAANERKSPEALSLSASASSSTSASSSRSLPAHRERILQRRFR